MPKLSEVMAQTQPPAPASLRLSDVQAASTPDVQTMQTMPPVVVNPDPVAMANADAQALTANRAVAIQQSLGSDAIGLGAQGLNYIGGLIDRHTAPDSLIRRGSDAVLSNVIGAPVAAIHHAQNIPVGLAQGATHLANTVTGGNLGNAVSSIDNLAKSREDTYQAGTPTNLGSLAGAAVGETVPFFAGGGILKGAGVLPDATTYLGKLATGALGGGAMGVTAPVTSGDNFATQKAMQIGLGTALGGAIPSAINAPAALGKSMVGKLTPETMLLMAKAKQQGIDLTAPQVSKSYPLKVVDSVTGQMPLSGAGAFRNTQQAQFNNALARTIKAPETGTLTPDVFSSALQDSGARFNNLYNTNNLTIDQPLLKKLAGISHAAEQIPDPAVASALNANIDHIIQQGATGQLPGKVFGLNDSFLGSVHKNGGAVGHIYGEFQDALRDAMQKGMSPADSAALGAERGTYRNLMTLEPLVAKATGTDGNISPALLASAVMSGGAAKHAVATGTRGDLADLSAIGQRFLKNLVPDSGTSIRSAVIRALAPTGKGLAAAGAGFVNLPATAVGLGTARAIQQGLRSRALFESLGKATGSPQNATTTGLGVLGTQGALTQQQR